MTDTRLVLAVLATLTLNPVVPAADKNPPPRKPGLETGRVRLLAEIVRADPDDRKRRTAVSELGDADPRVHPEVIPTLVGALKQEAVEVRAAAAAVIGRFKTTFPLAGAALESAAESDPSPTVRDAARQALWQYHLNGYYSAKAAVALSFQTAEPPLAKPGPPRATPPAPPPVPVVRTVAEASPFPHRPDDDLLPPINLPPGPLPGPRVALLPGYFGPRSVLAEAFRSNRTIEPPFAKQPGDWFPSPTFDEPPHTVRWLHPASAGKPPAFVRELPSVVSDPGPIPGVIPFPDPTPEPPIAGVGR